MIDRKVWLRGCATALLCVFTLGFSHRLPAQEAEQAPPPASPQPQTNSVNDPGIANGQPAPDGQAPNNDRILWSLPNYATVDKSASPPPLTNCQKFAMAAQGTFNPFEFAFIGIEASINQASGTYPTFGRGFVGYAKRYGTAYTDNAVGSFMTGAVFPTALRQDPRYFRMGKGNVFRRALYAASRILIVRSDSGRSEFNFSEVLGNGVMAAFSNVYHPAPRTVDGSLRLWGAQVGWDSVGFQLREFWPDLQRLFHRHKRTG